MKKSLSLIVSVLFAALCLGFSFSAYADDAKVLTDTNVTLSQQNFVYDGTAKNPAVIYNGITLSENTDYTVKYSNNVDVGTFSLHLICFRQILPVLIIIREQQSRNLKSHQLNLMIKRCQYH